MAKDELPPYSILMSIYKNETPSFLVASIDSMLNQTLPFDEFVIVKDGPLTDGLNEILTNYSKNDPRFKIVSLKNNSGLGIALDIGLKECKNELVIRMDSDDISVPDRAERQISFMHENPDIDVVGGSTCEFRENPRERHRRIKRCPKKSKVPGYIIRRNPLNHMTVCFRKSKIESAGGYKSLPLMEDYWLWVRLYINGGKIDNINKVLTYARIGNGFEKRRGDKAQMKSLKVIQKDLLKNGLIDKKRKMINLSKMWVITHSPNCFRKLLYSMLREKC